MVHYLAQGHFDRIQWCWWTEWLIPLKLNVDLVLWSTHKSWHNFFIYLFFFLTSLYFVPSMSHVLKMSRKNTPNQFICLCQTSQWSLASALVQPFPISAERSNPRIQPKRQNVWLLEFTETQSRNLCCLDTRGIESSDLYFLTYFANEATAISYLMPVLWSSAISLEKIGACVGLVIITSILEILVPLYLSWSSWDKLCGRRSILGLIGRRLALPSGEVAKTNI